MVKRIADYIKLYIRYPFKRGVFLRAQYDAFWPILSCLAKLRAKLLLSHQRTVAVVGSLGKTTTRRSLQALLLEHSANQSFSNYGSCLAENVLKSRIFEKYGVYEVGIDHPGEMLPYAKLLCPDIVVVTSISSDHMRSFPSFEDTRHEKAQMIRQMKKGGTVVLNGDDENTLWMQSQTDNKVLTFGKQEHNDVRACDINTNGLEGLNFKVVADQEEEEIDTELLGEHFVYAILAAFAVGKSVGFSLKECKERLTNFLPTPARMEKIELDSGAIIIDDTFKSSHASYVSSLEFMQSVEAKRKIFILNDVQDPLIKQGDFYRQIGKGFVHAADYVILVGSEALRSVRAGLRKADFPEEKMVYVGRRVKDVILELKKLMPFKKGDVIFIKGVNTRRLRRITLFLKGNDVKCNVKHCKIKVEYCDECPLLNRDVGSMNNYYIQALIEA